MKKYIYQLLCSLFIGGTMVACTEDYMETDKGHDTLTLSVNQQELVLNEKNHSQEALALTCDMNPAFLGHVERGMRSPTLNTLQRICDGLGITLTELLLTETDNNASNNSASIQHVVDIMQQLNPAQAKHMADLVDSVYSLLTDTN